jgi:Protein of unknown function (DUF642)
MPGRNCWTLSVFVSFGSLILTALTFSGADAQQVVNPSFELPVAGPPNNYIEDPTTSSAIGWQFSGPAGTKNESGVQKNGSGFDAPATTDGQQSAFILNGGTISQAIEFKKGGDYELSFKMAAQAGPTPAEPVTVDLGGPLGAHSPPSNTSFNTVTVPFQITAGTHTLKFQGTEPFVSLNRVVFIDEVAIKPVAPEITKGPDGDLDPTSKVTLTVKHAGKDKGKVRIHFPSPSAVKFDNSTSKDNLDLDVPGTWNDDGTITTVPILQASSRGAVDEQTVDVTVIAADGQQSSPVHAKFHNTPAITGVSPDSITPGQSFNVKGWDFGADAGTVTIHFTDNLFHSSSLDSKDDKDAQIDKAKWTPSVVNATVPKGITAVVAQDVDISLTPKGGKASNAWKEKFNPTMAMDFAPVAVAQCANNTSLDLCNPAPGSYSGGGVCLGLDAAGIAPFGTSIWGYHQSCAWFSTDTGTDIYSAIVAPPWWTITKIDHSWEGVPPGVWEDDGDGATIEYDLNPLPPAPIITVTVNWNITPGGLADYAFNVWMKGPVGVPQ